MDLTTAGQTPGSSGSGSSGSGSSGTGTGGTGTGGTTTDDTSTSCTCTPTSCDCTCCDAITWTNQSGEVKPLFEKTANMNGGVHYYTATDGSNSLWWMWHG